MFLFIWYVFTVSLLIIPLIIIILWLWCPSQLSCSTNSTGYLSPPTSNSYKVTLSTMNYRCKESPSIFCLYWYSNPRPYGSQPLHWPLGHILGSTFFSFFFFFEKTIGSTFLSHRRPNVSLYFIYDTLVRWVTSS